MLEGAGLVTYEASGTRRLYRLRPEGFADVSEFIGEFWDANLARLKTEAERQERALRAREQGQA